MSVSAEREHDTQNEQENNKRDEYTLGRPNTTHTTAHNKHTPRGRTECVGDVDVSRPALSSPGDARVPSVTMGAISVMGGDGGSADTKPCGSGEPSLRSPTSTDRTEGGPDDSMAASLDTLPSPSPMPLPRSLSSSAPPNAPRCDVAMDGERLLRPRAGQRRSDNTSRNNNNDEMTKNAKMQNGETATTHNDTENDN